MIIIDLIRFIFILLFIEIFSEFNKTEGKLFLLLRTSFRYILRFDFFVDMSEDDGTQALLEGSAYKVIIHLYAHVA